MNNKIVDLSDRLTIGNYRASDRGIRCDRKTYLGNPFHLINEPDRAIVVRAYKIYLYETLLKGQDPKEAALDISGRLGVPLSNTWKEPTKLQLDYQISKLQKTVKRTIDNTGHAKLMCWCSPKPCHCDELKNYLLYTQKQWY